MPRASSRSSAIASSTSSRARASTSEPAASCAPCRDPERQGERDEPLLGPVVEIAFDSPPLGVGRRNDAGARGAHLGELRPHFCRQALVLEHEPCRARTASTRAGSSSNAGSCTSAATSSPRTVTSVIARSGLRKLQRPARSVHVAAIAQAIGDVDGRVAEHLGEALPKARRSVRPQLDHEVGCLRSAQSRPRQSRDEAEWNKQRDRDRSCRSSPSPHRSRSSRPARERAEELRSRRRRAAAPARVGRPAQPAQAAHEQPQHAERDGDAEGSLHAVDGVGDRPPLRDSEHVARVGRDEYANELTAERRHIGGGDGTRAACDQARPSGKVSTTWTRTATQAASSRKPSVHKNLHLPIGDPRRAARMRRGRAGRGTAASASAPGRRGKPRRGPMTTRDPQPRAPRRRRRRLRASRCRGPQPRLPARGAPGRGARSLSAKAW